LTGEETFDIEGLLLLLENNFAGGKEIMVRAHSAGGGSKELRAVVRIDTPQEILYYKHGGILPYVLRQLLGAK
jgi:aconitate hydratase